ncbi:MAG: hypothetical protein ABR521_07540 [Gaiellaceae bacterium]
MRRLFALLSLALLALLASGCGDDVRRAGPGQAAAPTCPKAWRAGWQRLADRIGTAVYCPTWLPGPLTGEIGGPWTSIDSVDEDGSYLISFIYKEKAEEVHVNFRGYPGRTKVPTCIDVQTGAGQVRRRKVPCFADPRGTKRVGGIDATVYTVNRDADQWHVLYAWRRDGTLYSVSEHIAPPYSFSAVVRNLERMLRTLALVEPADA